MHVMGREKEVCCGEPTQPAPKFRVTNGGNRVRVIATKPGEHECGTCGWVYPAGMGEAQIKTPLLTQQIFGYSEAHRDYQARFDQILDNSKTDEEQSWLIAQQFPELRNGRESPPR